MCVYIYIYIYIYRAVKIPYLSPFDRYHNSITNDIPSNVGKGAADI